MPFDNNPSADIEMPFGKHAGKPLSEVPPQYLGIGHITIVISLYIRSCMAQSSSV